MVAVILCAGNGTRMKGLREKNKCMMLVNNKPLIERTIEFISNIDIISEIIVVIGYRGNEIKEYIGNCYNNKPIIYVIQNKLNGIVGAIECAKDYIRDNDFFLLLGDEYLKNPPFGEMISKFLNSNYFAYLGVVEVNDRNIIKKTYTVDIDSNKNVKHLIEKPEIFYNNLMGSGYIIFRNKILEYIKITPINAIRGERDLVSLIQMAIDDGKDVGVYNLLTDFLNMNDQNDFKRLVMLYSMPQNDNLPI